MTASGIRVLIVDDHPVVREGLAALLARQPDIVVVGEAADGEQALEQFRHLRPSVTLMDLRLPRLSGLAAIGRLCRDFPGTRIIVLSTYETDEEIFQALQAGARGYLLKTAGREELLDAIRAVHAGSRRLAPAAAARLAERVTASELTARELDVVRLIAQGRSNKEIAGRLRLTEGTVKNYVHGILAKLEVADRTQIALAALRRGIVHLD